MSGRAKMANLDKDIAALKLFNEKADKLANSRFIKTLLDGESGFRFSWGAQVAPVSERYGPDQEAIEAFTLTYRFFVQDREPCSLRNLAKMYPRLPVGPSLLQRFGVIRSELHRFLAGPPAMPITVDNTKARKEYTNQDIIDTFMNGNLAHTNNEETRARFESWRSMPLVFPIFEFNFVRAFALMTKGILQIRSVNVEALDQLSKRQVSETA